MDEIRVTYFSDMFNTMLYNKMLEEDLKHSIYEELNYIDALYNPTISNEKTIKIMDEILLEICYNYITLSDVNIVISDDLWRLIIDLIDLAPKNSYKKSFLYAIDIIMSRYLSALGLGEAICSNQGKEKSNGFLKVILNDRFKLTDLTGVNLSQEETSKLIINLVMMERNKKIGPLPKTKIEVISFKKKINL